MFSTFDLYLLLYVIRLAGWLKHCKIFLLLLILSGESRFRKQNLRYDAMLYIQGVKQTS